MTLDAVLDTLTARGLLGRAMYISASENAVSVQLSEAKPVAPAGAPPAREETADDRARLREELQYASADG